MLCWSVFPIGIKNIDYLFIYLLAIFTSSFENSLFSSFPHLLIGLLLWCLIFWVHCIFWIVIPCLWIADKDFFPFFGLSLHSDNCFLCRGFFCYYMLSFVSYFLLSLHWGHIVTLTKVLTTYPCWVHPLHHSPLSPFPYSWSSFNRSQFSIFIHEYIVFPPHSLSYTLSLHPPLPLVPTLRQDMFYLPVLHFWKKILSV
jgi:hypothetical protein